MLGDEELDRDVLDDFLSHQGAELLMTLGRHLFSRHQDVAQLSKVRFLKRVSSEFDGKLTFLILFTAPRFSKSRQSASMTWLHCRGS